MTLALSELLCCAAIAVVLDRKYRRNAQKSREWTKKWLSKQQHFSHVNLLKVLRFHPKDWHNFLRMSESTYLTLLSMVSPLIQKKNTAMRQAVTPHERLTATLRFLATEKLRGPQVFHYNVSTSTGKNCTRNLPCDLQSAEGIL